MTYYAKLFNSVPAISATYKDANGTDQTVIIAGGGAVTAVPFPVLQLPGVVRAKTAGNLKIYSDAGATTEITTLPNSTVASSELPLATTAAPGAVRKLPAQVDSVASTAAGIVTDFNALLAKLRTAGILT